MYEHGVVSPAGCAALLCLSHNTWVEPLGGLPRCPHNCVRVAQTGTWHALVRTCPELVPGFAAATAAAAAAAARCSGRVRVVITTLPLLQREVVTNFKVRGVPRVDDIEGKGGREVEPASVC